MEQLRRKQFKVQVAPDYTKIDIYNYLNDLGVPIYVTFSEDDNRNNRVKQVLPIGTIICVPYGNEGFLNDPKLLQGYLIPIPQGSYMKLQGVNGVIHHVLLPADSNLSIQ